MEKLISKIAFITLIVSIGLVFTIKEFSQWNYVDYDYKKNGSDLIESKNTVDISKREHESVLIGQYFDNQNKVLLSTDSDNPGLENLDFNDKVTYTLSQNQPEGFMSISSKYYSDVDECGIYDREITQDQKAFTQVYQGCRFEDDLPSLMTKFNSNKFQSIHKQRKIPIHVEAVEVILNPKDEYKLYK